MLEIRDLVKVYKPKKGVPVRALNGVSLKFPDRGMVFLLGKSGCGKSTLLNILGGLDRSTSGEILIMGQSSKTFRQSHFDSYRNTYVGFIFQEYNILEEFSVGANIALALQLQGIRPTDQQINAILQEVDLAGYGSRKPNELSGGQKQRVAIARALVKNPKIIMADEPTGALDSGTGRQVLTTLKKLSRDKLVIVVSHDREFAEQYGDRIIELADGRVIRDMERSQEGLSQLEAPLYDGSQVTLPEGYHLTDEDRRAICDYIQTMVSQGRAPQFSLAGQRDAGSFRPTDQSRIQSSQSGYHLIKSRLPMAYAFKLGASGLKYKKVRLVFTIILSCVAFTLFGLADTMASYDYVTTATSSLLDPESHVDYVAFEKSQVYTDDGSSYTYDPNIHYFYPEDLELIEDRTGLEVYPVYTEASLGCYLTFHYNLPSDALDLINDSYYSLYPNYLAGLVAADEDLLEQMGVRLIAGELPTAANEIVISSHVAKLFQKYGYTDGSKTVTISQPEDLLGKSLQLGDEYGYYEVYSSDGYYTSQEYRRNPEYVICGILDTDLDYDRYEPLEEEIDYQNTSLLEQLAYTVLAEEFTYSYNYSLVGIGIVAPESIPQNVPAASCVIASMPEDSRGIRTLVEFSATEFESNTNKIFTFDLCNPVCFELKALDIAFETMRNIFLWIGVFFVIFASLLFSNFIATSISYKKREIGILRAIGSRSNDVFRIFFAESFIIAMINFTLSLAGTLVICGIINSALRNQLGLLLTVLNVGIRQVVLLLGICLLVAAVASFLPVRRIAAKRPVDAIRDR